MKNNICPCCYETTGDPTGKTRWIICPACIIAKKPGKIERYRTSKQLPKDLTARGMAKRYLTADTADFNEKMLAEIYKATHTTTYIHGDPGTGKTHAAACAMRWCLLNERMSCLFVNVPSLVIELQSVYGKQGASVQETIQPYLNAKHLFLDDLGAEKLTEAVEQILYVIINKRYEECLHTVITSNLTIPELNNRLQSDRIASRISIMSDVFKM